ncbi:hypothetical protein U1Q18_018214, partial [Sarracenia purpurea var. burkii]
MIATRQGLLVFYLKSSMACNPYLSLRFRTSFASLHESPISPRLLPKRRLGFSPRSISHKSMRDDGSSSIVSASRFTWEDAFEIARSENDSSDLHGFFDKIKICNRGSEKRHEFIPFVIKDKSSAMFIT